MRGLRVLKETNVYLLVGESEQDVLRAIVKASFDLAKPENLSVVDYKPDHSLTDEEADGMILSPPRSHDGCVVDMDFVEGRRCATFIKKERMRGSSVTFILDNTFFDRHRDDHDTMLNLAEEIFQKTKESKDPSPNWSFDEFGVVF